MYKIQKLNSISNLVNDIFDENYLITAECDNPDLILVRSAAMADYAVGDKLLAVGRAGAGVNNIPFADYVKKGVVVFNTPGANANAVKELVISALLLSCRRIYEGIGWAQSLIGKGDEVKGLVEKGKSQFVGREISGKTLGVIGMGAIGRLVAESASALGMNIVGYDPYLPAGAKFNCPVKIVASLDDVYAVADFITIHVPFVPATKGFINAEAIGKMKDGVAVINCARGELVNNADIIAAVKANKVSKYFTDFPTEDLLNIDNIITCPHLGASTPEAEDNCAVMVAQQLKDYVENGNIKNSVNFPKLSVARNGNRVTVLADNNPAIITSVNSVVADFGVLAVNSASKNDALYIVADTTSPLTAAALANLAAIDGVYKVRAL